MIGGWPVQTGAENAEKMRRPIDPFDPSPPRLSTPLMVLLPPETRAGGRQLAVRSPRPCEHVLRIPAPPTGARAFPSSAQHGPGPRKVGSSRGSSARVCHFFLRRSQHHRWASQR